MTFGQIVIGGFALLGLGAIIAKALHKPEPEEKEEEKKGPSSPKAQPPAPGRGGVYRTPLGRSRLTSSGFAPVPSGGFVNVEPPIDTETGLYARMSPEDQLAFARSIHPGARFLKMPEVYAIYRVGFKLKPCTLVFNQNDLNRMQTIEYARKHDECLRAQLKGWDGKQPLINDGKYWVFDDDPSDHGGNYRNGGWVTADGKAIQPGGSGSEHHGAGYVDYSQLTKFWIPSLPA